ncbi:hypothetical protein AC1031_014065 [Aphanomyces cochlioides]|nr:hypothetical protein AC1031_014065 [Aphanomyces cochlioides]
MDANTYQVLSQLQAERMGPGGTDDTALLGYNAADSTIASDPLDCSSANGAIKSLWDTKYTVCVLQDIGLKPYYCSSSIHQEPPRRQRRLWRRQPHQYLKLHLPIVVSIAGSSVSPVVTGSSGGNSTPTTDTPTANSTPKPTTSSKMLIGNVSWFTTISAIERSRKPTDRIRQVNQAPPQDLLLHHLPQSSSSNTGVIAGASVGGVALVAIIVGVFIFRCRQQNAKDVTSNGFGTTLTPTVTTTGKEDAALNLEGLAMVRVEEREVELHSVLGTGAFADVWLGSFQGSPVAIKKMHRHRATPTQLESYICA